MHRFHPDDSAVLFLDAFGLTRLALPKKVKTDRKIRGGWGGYVDLSETGDRALVYDADWWRIYTYTFPDLKPWQKYERFQYRQSNLLGDGAHLLDGDTVRTMGGEATGTLTNEGCKLLKPLRFGPYKDIGYYIYSAFPGRSYGQDRFAETNTPDWEWLLDYGVCTNTGARCLWRRPLQVHGGHRHGFYPHGEGLVLTSLAPRSAQVYVQWLDEAGNPGRLLQADGITVPVWAFGRLAWQQDEDTIIVEDDEQQRQSYSISAVTRVAHSGKKHPRALPKGDFLGDLTNVGAGEILLGPKRVLFVPWHGETILDLTGQTEIHRKLPPDEFEIRRHFRETIARANRFAREADMLVNGGFIQIHKKDKSFSTGYAMTRGEGGIVGLLVSGAVSAHINEDEAFQSYRGWRWRGGSGGGHDYLSGTYGEEDLLRAFAMFDAHNVPFDWVLWPLRSVYERRLRQDRNHHGEVMGPVLTRPAEKLLLQAYLASRAASRGAADQVVPLLAQVDTWRSATLDKEQYQAAAKQASRSNIDADLFSYLVRSYFDEAIPQG